MEHGTPYGKRIEVGRGAEGRAEETDIAGAHAIEHDDERVEPLGSGRGCTLRKGRGQGEAQRSPGRRLRFEVACEV
jgi:hypothetical protein